MWTISRVSSGLQAAFKFLSPTAFVAFGMSYSAGSIERAEKMAEGAASLRPGS
jgi:hypothetical protein